MIYLLDSLFYRGFMMSCCNILCAEGDTKVANCIDELYFFSQITKSVNVSEPATIPEFHSFCFSDINLKTILMAVQPMFV